MEITPEIRTYLSYVQAWAIFLLLLIVARRPALADEVLNSAVEKIIKILKIIFMHIVNGGMKK